MAGEFRSGPVAGTALVAGVTFARKGVQYAEVDGLALFEGDIVLGSAEAVRATADGPVLASVGLTGSQFRWPGATLAYDIDPTLPNPQRVTDAIAHWEANTRIRFVLRTPANAAQYPDFVHFQSGAGCSSMVGRRGGQQNITLGGGCTTGNAIHEIGHAVGLWHEQSREDRDTFVQIVWPNIDPAMQHNFAQHVSDGDDLGPYDYGSIMHYPPTAFSINGQATIVARQALPPGVVMGQRTGLSRGDVDGVHAMYPAAPPTIKEVPKDPVKDLRFDTVKETRKDPIFETVKEIRKDPIRDTLKELAKDPIRDTLPVPWPLPGPLSGATGEVTPGASPFILATPSRAGGGPSAAFEAVQAQVQQLGAALAALEQQQAELSAAYEVVVQALAELQQG